MPDKEEKSPAVAALEAIESKIMDHIKGYEEKTALQIKELTEKGEADKKLAEEMEEHKATLAGLQDELDKLRAEARRPDFMSGAKEEKTVGELFSEDENAQEDLRTAIEIVNGGSGGSLPRRQDYCKSYKFRNFFPLSNERKTTITSGTVGSSTPGILTPDRVRDYVPGIERRLTIRDLLPSRPTTSNVVEFPKENVFTNAASPQTEGSAKAEAALTFAIDSETVRTLAHWIPATAQVLDDWPSLGRIINAKLLYGLKLVEETEILSGSGAGVHLSGLTTEATAYAATYLAANDQKLDTLAHAILEAEDDDYEVDFIVLNPKDLHDIMLLKTEDSGTANTGAYLMGDRYLGPIAIPTVWGRPVVKTNSMTSGSFLVGNTSEAEVFDRMQANIMISTEHDTYFTANMVAIRAEERIALAVYRGGAFIYGSF